MEGRPSSARSRSWDGVSWICRVHAPAARSPQQWVVMNPHLLNPSAESSCGLFLETCLDKNPHISGPGSSQLTLELLYSSPLLHFLWKSGDIGGPTGFKRSAEVIRGSSDDRLASADVTQSRFRCCS